MTSLDALLARSEELDNSIVKLLAGGVSHTYNGSARITASASACSASIDHARGLRILLKAGLPGPAIGLMRLQYEALTRSVWLLYAATDGQVEKLQAHLTPDAESAANGLPTLTPMLSAIKGKAPAPAVEMLTQFKAVMASALNSFVHSGIHLVRRQSDGYPPPLVRQVIVSSNGLFTMTGMMFAILSGNQAISTKMSQIQPAFKDCLPALSNPAPKN